MGSRALLFGSWAVRYLGEPGPPPGDVDVLIVGSPARREVARIVSRLSTELGREINTTIVPSARWHDAPDGFVRNVKRGPIIELVL